MCVYCSIEIFSSENSPKKLENNETLNSDSSDFLMQSKYKIEMKLEPVSLQLEHIATNQRRNHHSNHLDGGMVGGMVVTTSVCSDML